MNFADYFKSLFGIRGNDKSVEIQGLGDFINMLKDSYTVSKGDVPSYERKNPVVKTDEEIREEAEKSLEEYFNGNKENIENEYNSNVKKKQDGKQKYEYELQNELEKIADSYNTAQRKSDNDSLKQGIARSSIAEKKTEKLGEQRKKTENILSAEYESKIKDIDSEIAELEVKRNKALNDLNISYAAKLADNINKLTKERDKIVDDALEYNNKMEKLEYEQKQQAEKLSEFTPDEDFFRQVYLKADELLSKMTPTEARDAVNNNMLLKEYLNDYYYYKLYEKYCK